MWSVSSRSLFVIFMGPAVLVTVVCSNCLWHHMAYAQFVIINMLLGFSAYSSLAVYARSLSLSLPFSFPFAHPVNLSNNLLRLLRVPLFHRRPGRRRRRFAAVTMPTHHMMIYSCPPGLSCRLRSVGRSVACFFSLHISSIYVRIYFLTKNLISPHCLLFS